MKVIPWTVNEVSDMKTVLEKGVHGIITDFPDRLPTLLEDMKKTDAVV
jgi:glycerophosphoryl diester phosphodiesterase